MRWNRVGANFDSKVGDLAERASRSVTRRHAVRMALVGGATGIAALTVGVDPALADACTNNCGPTRRCSNCPSDGCPSGYSLCKGSMTGNCFNNQGYRCEWPSGYWQACNRLGQGYGSENCYDCIGPGGCADWCTCLSSCICCSCQDAADVLAEQMRVQQLVAAS